MFDNPSQVPLRNPLRRWLLAIMTAAGLVLVQPAVAGFDAGVSAHKQADYETALAEFQADAINGDARSQYMLGEMYRLGQGVDRNMELAAEWYRAAAELGHPAAQNALGTLYAIGQGLDQDDTQAYVWFSLSALLGNPTAEKNLARAKELIADSNRKFGDQIIKQYLPMYVLPFKPTPGFDGTPIGMPGAE